MTPSLEEVFAVPAGADWKIKRDKKTDEVVVTRRGRRGGPRSARAIWRFRAASRGSST